MYYVLCPKLVCKDTFAVGYTYAYDMNRPARYEYDIQELNLR